MGITKNGIQGSDRRHPVDQSGEPEMAGIRLVGRDPGSDVPDSI